MALEIIIKIEGLETERLKEVDSDDDRLHFSDYARFFDEICAPWTNDPEYNLMFLRQQEIYATDLLKTKGYLFLNDVYDMLGIPRSKAGQVIGWIYDEKNPHGDNYVDFGLYNKANKDFINGHSKSVLLDFNVDGLILDKVL